MKTYRLKENHPTYQKFLKLYNLAEKLGISLEFIGDQCFLVDFDLPKIRFQVKDIEPNHILTSFPYPTEFEITYQKPHP